MLTYKYTALGDSGEKIEGMIEAFDDTDAIARIRENYNTVLSMEEISSVHIKLPAFLTKEIGLGGLNSKAFTLMCNQFSTILKAGIPLARAVNLIAEKTADRPLKSILKKVGLDVEAGRTLSASFRDHGSHLLPPTFVETIRAGEESGDLPGAFTSIYKHYDKQTKMADKVRAAMIYPVFVLCIAVGVVIVMMVQVVPAFTNIFESSGRELPMMTQMLVNISTFVQHTFLIFIIIAAAIVVALLIYKKTEHGALVLGQLQLNIPVLGNIEELNAASLFANTMATMVGSGIPMTKAVTITADVMTNSYVREQTAKMVAGIEEGRTVTDTMKQANCFPEILIDMVGVGEETGEVKDTLDTISLYYDTELEVAITQVISMLEPALLVFIAIVAGFIVIAIYMSMFDMYSVL